VVSALDRKLVRDLARLRGQIATIALVVACGIASYVAMQSAFESLSASRDRYYDENRLPHVFAHLERAPEAVRARLEAIPGVATLETRLVETVLVPVPDLAEPAMAELVTLPPGGEPALASLHVRSGRLPEPGRADEVVVQEAFADAHALRPGATLPAVVNGVRRDLRVVGLALSPEFVFSGTASSPYAEEGRYGVVWMDRAAVAPAFRMEGAFDDVVLALQPGADERGVTDEVDRVLAPYGGLGAVGRGRQASAMILDAKLVQLSKYATVVPAIFLAVAAFLVNVVLSRVVSLQRGQIATLRALGYGSMEIGLHFAKLVGVVVAFGAVAGASLGAWMGHGMMGVYAPYFRMPRLDYVLAPAIVVKGVLVSLVAGFAGAAQSVRSVLRLAPAEAMQPEAPPRYEPSLLERLGVGRLLGDAGRMVLRELTRRPLRALLSILGIAASVAIIVAARFMVDAIAIVRDVELGEAHREDLLVAFREPLPAAAEHAIARLPGVLATEPGRTAAVRARRGHLFRDVALVGHPARPDLRRVLEWPVREIALAEGEIVLTETLGELLDARVGDTVELEVLEGDRRTVRARVSGFSSEMIGLSAHATLGTVHRMLGEEGRITEVSLQIDDASSAALDRRLAELPTVAAVMRPAGLRAAFDKQTGDVMAVTTLILTLFGATIAIAIVYNGARIALSTRARDLATLRVLGFTRGEISAVLLGELAVEVLAALPLGVALGRALMLVVVRASKVETFRFPPYVSPKTLAFAAAVTAVAALVSALLVRRRLDHLDLVAVLKARE
jgi:putative ABC transport system permease protein